MTCSRECGTCSQASRDEELIGVLTAISVVSRQLAVKLTRLSQQEQIHREGGKSYGQNERTCGCRF